MKVRNVIIISVVILLIQLYTIYNLKTSNDVLVENVSSLSSNEKYFKILKSDYINSIKSDGFILRDSIFLLGENKNEVSFDSIIRSGKKLVIRYSPMACSACVENMIKLLNEKIEEIGSDNVIFISPFTSKRTIDIIKNNFNSSFDIYLNSSFGLPI